jgi:hypothetical protein
MLMKLTTGVNVTKLFLRSFVEAVQAEHGQT